MDDIEKKLEEIKKDLASMSKEDRLKMEKEIDEMVEELRNSEVRDDQKKVKKNLKEIAAIRKTKLKFIKELISLSDCVMV